jgi:hypothetical protein
VLDALHKPFNGIIKPGKPGYDDQTEKWPDIIE